jgi:hypothetical protein
MNVQQLTEKFVADLSVAVRQEVLDDLMKKLGGPGAPRVAKSMSDSITPTLMQRAMKRVGKSAKPAPYSGGGRIHTWGKGRKVGEKRTEKEIHAVTARIAAVLKATPKGLSSEDIQMAVRLPNADIQLPLKRLLERRVIRKRGMKRATRYFPAK